MKQCAFFSTRLRALVTLTALAGLAPQAQAGYGPAFTFDLHPTSNSYDFSSAYGIFGAQVAGSAIPAGSGLFHAMLWSATADTALDLNPSGFIQSGLEGISGPQQVGDADTPATYPAGQPLLWSGSAGNYINLTPSGCTTGATDGAFGGQQVGIASGTATGNKNHAFLWSGTAASAVDLNPSGFVSSGAVAIWGNHEAGSATPVGAVNPHAILWSGTAASYVDLHPGGFFFSAAYAIYGTQQVGEARASGPGQTHAALWSGTAESFLDLNPSGLVFSAANATNGVHQAGQGHVSGGADHALVWSGSADSVIDLHSLLPGEYSLSVATSIDPYDNIAGYATDALTGEEHAIEWLAGNLYKPSGDGVWAASANWTSGAPAGGQDLMLLQADATNRSVSFSNSNGSLVFGKLTIDAVGSGAMTLAQAQDSLRTTSEVIGLVGRGVVSQTGGTHTAGATTINANSVVNYNGGSYSAGNLMMNGNGEIVLSAGRDKVLMTSAVSLDAAGGAKIDLGDNSMQINYGGSSPLSTIASYIKTGYAGGAWTGNGITSTAAAAAASASHKTALGYAEASQIGAGSSTVTVCYTFAGDANLDGKVDTLDFNSLAANFGGSGKAWSQADFNYDGVVDTLDFNNLAANFGQQLAKSASPASLVPEPAAVSLLACVIAAHATRRRERLKKSFSQRST